METDLEQKVCFDGEFRRKEADQFINRCKGGAINLHIYRMGYYNGCAGCEHQNSCQNSGYTAGEQAEL